MDGVTLFAAGLIAGGAAILAIAVVAMARRVGLVPDRRAGRGRAYGPARPRDARLRADLDGARSRTVFRDEPIDRRGGLGLDAGDPRARDYQYRDPRRTPRRDDGGLDRLRRPDGNSTVQGPPRPPSALVGDTVQLQSVPAWSIPARPLNIGPQPPRPQPDESPNGAPRYVAPTEPGGNTSRRHEISRPGGRVYGGR